VEAGIEEERFRKREIEITKLMKQAQGVELQAPESSSVALEAKQSNFARRKRPAFLSALRETAEPEERRRCRLRRNEPGAGWWGKIHGRSAPGS